MSTTSRTHVFPALNIQSLAFCKTYRIWVVWDRHWSLIVFPALCTLGYVGACIPSIFELHQTSNEKRSHGHQRYPAVCSISSGREPLRQCCTASHHHHCRVHLDVSLLASLYILPLLKYFAEPTYTAQVRIELAVHTPSKLTLDYQSRVDRLSNMDEQQGTEARSHTTWDGPNGMSNHAACKMYLLTPS